MDAETRQRFDKLDERHCELQEVIGRLDALIRGSHDGDPGMLETQRGHTRWLVSHKKQIGKMQKDMAAPMRLVTRVALVAVTAIVAAVAPQLVSGCMNNKSKRLPVEAPRHDAAQG